MKEFDQLRTDVMDLISAATDTVNQLVAKAASQAQNASTVGASGPTPDDVATYASQMTQLSTDVKAATQRLKDQAAAILGNAPSSSSGSQSGGFTAQPDPSVISGADLTTGAAPAGSPPLLGTSDSSASQQADQSSLQPASQGRSIGPESFKAGA